VETAYISNPKEEILLRSGSFQEKIAEVIVGAINEFFSLQLPATPELILTKEGSSEIKSSRNDPQKTPEPKISPYKVQKGDTLTRIAE
jgi:LysM repeat protein